MKKVILFLTVFFYTSIIFSQSKTFDNADYNKVEKKKFNVNLLSNKTIGDTLMYFDGFNGWVSNPADLVSFEFYTEELTGQTLDSTPTVLGLVPEWMTFYYFEGGDTAYTLGSCSWFVPPGQANNWIYFGPITIPIIGATLKWEHRISDHNRSDGYKVYISNTGISNSDFVGTTPIYSRQDNPPDAWKDTVWTVNTVNIPNIYNGQQVYVGFQHDAYDQYLLLLSRFLLTEEPNQSTGVLGKVFHDINENGQFDIGEQGAAGHLVKLEPGPHYFFTNNEGMYCFAADTGAHTISYVPYGYWGTTSNSSYNFTIDSVGHFLDTLHFGIAHKTDINDVSVYIIGSPTRVGFETNYWLACKNWGTVTASGSVNFVYDTLLTYNSSTYAPTSHISNVLVFDYDTLGPGVQKFIKVNFQVPGFQHFGDTLYSNAWITPLVPD